MIIISNFKEVDKAILSIDEDRAVCPTLKKIANKYYYEYDLAFANGGGQNNTILERTKCKVVCINVINGFGDKIQSSSSY